MKLLRFSERQLKDYVAHSLFPEHVKHFFFKMLDYNNLRITEYVSSMFNLSYILNYETLTPNSVFESEYQGVLRDFHDIEPYLMGTEVYMIYGIEPLDAIYRHSAVGTGYDCFCGSFYDDLYVLMETVDADNGLDYMGDISLLAHYLIQVLERHYVIGETMQAVYIAVNATPDYLHVIVR